MPAHSPSLQTFPIPAPRLGLGAVAAARTRWLCSRPTPPSHLPPLPSMHAQLGHRVGGAGGGRGRAGEGCGVQRKGPRHLATAVTGRRGARIPGSGGLGNSAPSTSRRMGNDRDPARSSPRNSTTSELVSPLLPHHHQVRAPPRATHATSRHQVQGRSWWRQLYPGRKRPGRYAPPTKNASET